MMVMYRNTWILYRYRRVLFTSSSSVRAQPRLACKQPLSRWSIHSLLLMAKGKVYDLWKDLVCASVKLTLPQENHYRKALAKHYFETNSWYLQRWKCKVSGFRSNHHCWLNHWEEFKGCRIYQRRFASHYRDLQIPLVARTSGRPGLVMPCRQRRWVCNRLIIR
jgi:hypothetical protein